ncbi:S-(hydroxymethyl)glutathione synthase [Burkholderiales bacterium]|nr:S-(hydroxymethyl)glutathione synthase [Burkholderiales bacterium]
MSAGEARGSCHCGAVRFVARFPSRFVAHCHCASCRRAHGAAFVTWAGFPSAQVDVVEGRDALAAHESSAGTRRLFCGRCGTKLLFMSERWPGETHVALAAFDEPVDRPPTGHVFWDEHVPWLPPLAAPPE